MYLSLVLVWDIEYISIFCSWIPLVFPILFLSRDLCYNMYILGCFSPTNVLIHFSLSFFSLGYLSIHPVLRDRVRFVSFGLALSRKGASLILNSPPLPGVGNGNSVFELLNSLIYIVGRFLLISLLIKPLTWIWLLHIF